MIAAGPAGGDIAVLGVLMLTVAGIFDSALEDGGPLLFDAGVSGRRDSARNGSDELDLMSGP